MKFGRKISNDLYNEWRPYYIDYNLLKRELKAGARTTSHNWTDEDEREFTAMLEKELDKIHVFQKTKTYELSRRINDAEKAVKRLVALEHAETGHTNGNGHHRYRTSDSSDAEQQMRDGVSQDAGSDDDDMDDEDEDTMSVDALEDQFQLLEEEVATLVADVHDLALYTKLNITGFMKILKKQTNRPLKPTFIQEYLEKRPFYKYNWDGLIVKLSRLYDLVRTRGHPVQGDASAGGSQSAFVRQTTKYWVHPDNLVHLKLAILRHLPVLVFNPDKEFEVRDAAISSIYFDNEDLELYLGRLEKTEGAEAIRLRWYGDTNVKTVSHLIWWSLSFSSHFPHVDLCRAQDAPRGLDWREVSEGAVSNQGTPGERVPTGRVYDGRGIPGARLSREEDSGRRRVYDTAGERGAVRDPHKETCARCAPLFCCILSARSCLVVGSDADILQSHGVPAPRRRARADIARHRTHDGARGQLGQPYACGGELAAHRYRHRLSVRTGACGGQGAVQVRVSLYALLLDWRVGGDADVCRRYGVLEVKLQTQFGQEPPQWVTQLVSSHLVEAVPKVRISPIRN
ncbi:Vacuolar transporter chaperone 4 [Grifola frondosa]|uniref:Vacuolar transporter chaperone 4 n=1 Tax=Grifola frondosa TaxID=5627 RepID=A0A1C7M5B4_GRIFR|nr:Vacuolar transporter chaperone 4 [Grifola frondosa]